MWSPLSGPPGWTRSHRSVVNEPDVDSPPAAIRIPTDLRSVNDPDGINDTDVRSKFDRTPTTMSALNRSVAIDADSGNRKLELGRKYGDSLACVQDQLGQRGRFALESGHAAIGVVVGGQAKVGQVIEKALERLCEGIAVIAHCRRRNILSHLSVLPLNNASPSARALLKIMFHVKHGPLIFRQGGSCIWYPAFPMGIPSRDQIPPFHAQFSASETGLSGGAFWPAKERDRFVDGRFVSTTDTKHQISAGSRISGVASTGAELPRDR